MNHTKCPICGCEEIFYKEIINNSTSGETTRIVSKIGGQSAATVAGQVVGGVVGDFFGVGEQGATLGGKVASYIAGDQIDKEFDKRKNPTRIICNCPSCSLRWNSELHPQEVLRIIKRSKTKDDEVKFEWDGIITFLISAPIAGACWYYCNTQDKGFLWYLLGLGLIVAGLCAILGFVWIFSLNSNYISDLNMSRKTRKMTLEEYVQFRNVHGFLDYDVGGWG